MVYNWGVGIDGMIFWGFGSTVGGGGKFETRLKFNVCMFTTTVCRFSTAM